MDQWTEEWQRGDMEPADFAEGASWMRSRPESVKALMQRFPPAALVSAKDGKALRCPAPGDVGIVTSYHEPHPDDSCEACLGAPEGLIGVRDGPTGSVIHHCRPEWLEVVGFYKGMTAERVTSLLLD